MRYPQIFKASILVPDGAAVYSPKMIYTCVDETVNIIEHII
jgi:hypothetical protein